MKKQSVLKKEFKQRDVERMRNLVTGKYGERTTMEPVIVKQKNSTAREIFGRKMVAIGPLKMVLNKI
jgi:hypothetical protein